MTELAIQTDEPRLAPQTDIAVWAESARQAHSVSISLASTPFVPDSLRARKTNSDQTQADLDRITVGNITAAILTGQELGLQPMAALRSMDVIQGTPALRAITLRALVQGHGHEVWVTESTETRAIVCGKRAGSDKVQTSTWTLDRARGLALVGKDNWKKQPGAMLVARATSEICRLIAADAILAMPYSSEELSDGPSSIEFVPIAATVAAETAPEKVDTTPAPATRRMSRSKAVEAPSEAVETGPRTTETPASDGFDEFHPATTSNPDTGELRSAAQSTKLFVLFGKHFGKDEVAARAWLNSFLGADIASTKDLTKSQASRAIEELENTEPAPVADVDESLFAGES